MNAEYHIALLFTTICPVGSIQPVKMLSRDSIHRSTNLPATGLGLIAIVGVVILGVVDLEPGVTECVTECATGGGGGGGGGDLLHIFSR